MCSNCVGDELWSCMFGVIISSHKMYKNGTVTSSFFSLFSSPITTSSSTSSSSTSSTTTSSRLRLHDDIEVVTAVGSIARAITPLIFHNGQQTTISTYLTNLSADMSSYLLAYLSTYLPTFLLTYLLTTNDPYPILFFPTLSHRLSCALCPSRHIAICLQYLRAC